MTSFEELYENIQQHLDCTNQNWLFGAGISFESNIPLMNPLTRKIESNISGSEASETYTEIKKLLSEDAHIEHFLSQIGDLIALLERSQMDTLKINEYRFSKNSLRNLYKRIISEIGDLIRYGYKEKSNESGEIVGTIDEPIVEITSHRNFVNKLFNRRSNLENRTSINFFTTNYDTLLEDALILERKEVVDGFTGGAMGFWNPEEFEKSKTLSNRHKLYKLHGSIDWYKDQDNSFIRRRYGAKYLADNSNILIYPQATKYIETQKDPFATMFSCFRNHLQVKFDNILVICGYSFGDNHINNEIEISMSLPCNKTNLLVFVKEERNENDDCFQLPQILEKWLTDGPFKDKVFVLTNKGLYNGSPNRVTIDKQTDENYDWWTFEGLTNILD